MCIAILATDLVYLLVSEGQMSVAMLHVHCVHTVVFIALSFAQNYINSTVLTELKNGYLSPILKNKKLVPMSTNRVQNNYLQPCF